MICVTFSYHNTFDGKGYVCIKHYRFLFTFWLWAILVKEDFTDRFGHIGCLLCCFCISLLCTLSTKCIPYNRYVLSTSNLFLLMLLLHLYILCTSPFSCCRLCYIYLLICLKSLVSCVVILACLWCMFIVTLTYVVFFFKILTQFCQYKEIINSCHTRWFS